MEVVTGTLSSPNVSQANVCRPNGVLPKAVEPTAAPLGVDQPGLNIINLFFFVIDAQGK
jgi:hypothetical protein